MTWIVQSALTQRRKTRDRDGTAIVGDIIALDLQSPAESTHGCFLCGKILHSSYLQDKPVKRPITHACRVLSSYISFAFILCFLMMLVVCSVPGVKWPATKSPPMCSRVRLPLPVSSSLVLESMNSPNATSVRSRAPTQRTERIDAAVVLRGGSSEEGVSSPLVLLAVQELSIFPAKTRTERIDTVNPHRATMWGFHTYVS